MSRVPTIKDGDWSGVRQAIQKLDRKLGYESAPTFARLTLTDSCLIAAGVNFLRVTGLQTDGMAMTGILRGAYIDVSNGNTVATGTIRGMELKARTEAPGDTGNNVAVLEGLSISADSKGHSVTTMRAAEFILDGSSGGTITEAVGLRIANNLQANKATTSIGLQIYRDSFDYTYDISLSKGGHITGDSYVNQDLRIAASPTFAALNVLGLVTITRTNTQLDLKYDDSNNVTFSVTGAGNLNILASGTTIGFFTKNLINIGTVTAEQLTSTDDITMQGHLLTLGNNGSAANVVMSFLSSGNNGIITFDQLDDEFDFGNSNITTTTIVTAGTLAATAATISSNLNADSIIITAPVVSDVKIGGLGNTSIYFEGQNAGSSLITKWFTKTGAGNESNIFQIYGVGTVALQTNYEVLQLGWSSTASQYVIGSVAGGTGVVRELELYTGANADQLLLKTDGNILMSGMLEVTGLITATGGVTIGAAGGLTMTTNDLTLTTAANKTLVLSQVVYKDINIAGYLLTKPVSSAPGVVSFVDEAGVDTTIETYGFAVGELVHGGFELQHDYKEGTDLVFHVHWQGIAAPTGTDNVQWRLNYIVMRGNTTLNAAVVIDSPDTAIDTQYKVYRTDFGVITGTGFLIEDQFLFTLTRVAATGDAYAGEALIATAGIHYQIDTVGSRSIATK